MRKPVKKYGKNVIFRKWITRDGRRVYAYEYGLKAFCFEVDTVK